MLKWPTIDTPISEDLYPATNGACWRNKSLNKKKLELDKKNWWKTTKRTDRERERERERGEYWTKLKYHKGPRRPEAEGKRTREMKTAVHFKPKITAKLGDAHLVPEIGLVLIKAYFEDSSRCGRILLHGLVVFVPLLLYTSAAVVGSSFVPVVAVVVGFRNPSCFGWGARRSIVVFGDCKRIVIINIHFKKGEGGRKGNIHRLSGWDLKSVGWGKSRLRATANTKQGCFSFRTDER